jgi:hypothetical protein
MISSPQTPVLLVVAGLLIWTGFQTLQLVNERTATSKALENQAALMDNAKKMRSQLDAIAANTRRLADQGNSNARLIIEQLARNGVSINPQQAKP